MTDQHAQDPALGSALAHDRDGYAPINRQAGGANIHSDPSPENFHPKFFRHPAAVADEILMAASALRQDGQVDARVGLVESKLDHAHRKTDIVWLPPDWYDGVLVGAGMNANADWGYDVTGSENIQVGWYADGGHYGMHVDVDPHDLSRGYHRKVTVVCCLDGDYEGGELEVLAGEAVFMYRLCKGDMVAFPSWMQHRVHPVTSGTRVTAVKWLTGPFWR